MNITLIGMSGVGKTTYGKVLSKTLNYNFIDIDKLIEAKYNTKLNNVVEMLSSKEFLKMEEELIISLKLSGNDIISTPGSVIYEKGSMKFLKENSTIVFLDLPLEKLVKIFGNPKERGIVGLKEKGLKKIFEERRKLYQKYTQETIDLSDLDISKTVKENEITVVNQIIKKLNLNQKA